MLGIIRLVKVVRY